MKIAIVAGGFTPGEADQLRRAMATFKRTGTIGNFRSKMVEGMVGTAIRAISPSAASSQIEGFGEYGFPESHAASFALLVYASAWLKCRYPDAFAAALLNAQPMGFYAPAQIVRDVREHGVEVRPVDINHSDWDATLEDGPRAAERLHDLHRDMADDIRATHALRLGLRQIKGLREDDARLIVARRMPQTHCAPNSSDASIIDHGNEPFSDSATAPLASPPPLAGEGQGGACTKNSCEPAPSPTLPRKRGREPASASGEKSTELAAKSIPYTARIAPYTSVRDLWLRTGLSPRIIERLADADAFGSLGL